MLYVEVKMGYTARAHPDKPCASIVRNQATSIHVVPCPKGYSTLARPGDGKTGGRADAAVAVRMQQTGRSKSHCVGYLQRRSDPCDGGEQIHHSCVGVEVLTCAQRWFGSPS